MIGKDRYSKDSIVYDKISGRQVYLSSDGYLTHEKEEGSEIVYGNKEGYIWTDRRPHGHKRKEGWFMMAYGSLIVFVFYIVTLYYAGMLFLAFSDNSGEAMSLLKDYTLLYVLFVLIMFFIFGLHHIKTYHFLSFWWGDIGYKREGRGELFKSHGRFATFVDEFFMWGHSYRPKKEQKITIRQYRSITYGYEGFFLKPKIFTDRNTTWKVDK